MKKSPEEMAVMRESAREATEAKKVRNEALYNLNIKLSGCRIIRMAPLAKKEVCPELCLALEARSGKDWVHRGWYGKLEDVMRALLKESVRKEKGIELTWFELDEVKETLGLIESVHSEIDEFFSARAPRPCKAADESLIPLVWEHDGYVIYRVDGNALALTWQTRFDDEPIVIGWSVLYRQALGRMLSDVAVGPNIKTLGHVIDRVNAFLKWFDDAVTDANRHVEARDRLPKAPPMETTEE
jgi:hypothetical protein